MNESNKPYDNDINNKIEIFNLLSDKNKAAVMQYAVMLISSQNRETPKDEK